MKDTQPIYDIYINASAGWVINNGRERIEDYIKASGLSVNALHIDNCDKLFDQLSKRDQQKNAHILIGGGDGTIRSFSKALSEQNKSFGIIPLGTMNLLAHDLNLPIDIEALFDAYRTGVTSTSVDMAYANDEPFLCAAAIGTIPESSEFREQNRQEVPAILYPKLTAFVMEKLDAQYIQKHQMILNDNEQKVIRSPSLVISNNTFADPEDWSIPHIKKAGLHDGVLGIYAATPKNFWDKLRLITKLGFGGWKADPIIRELKCSKMILNNPGILLQKMSLDGETMDIEMPCTFHVKQNFLRILVPTSLQEAAE